jgi:transcription-repair coupling factor (superfamily II helicase)
VGLEADLIRAVREMEVVARAESVLATGEDTSLAVPASARPLLVAALFAGDPRPTLVLVSGEEEAERFARHLGAFLPHGPVLRLPERRTLPWAREAPDVFTVGRRARGLHALDKKLPVTVVASARSLLRRVPPHGSQVFDPLKLAPGATLDLSEVAALLAAMGYTRVDVAREPGEFAVRGGTLDVFGSDAASPVRADLLGDEIDELKYYLPTTGQTLGDAQETLVFACREVRLGRRAVSAARSALDERAKDDAILARDLDLMDEGVLFNGVERYLPALYRTATGVTDHVGPAVRVVAVDPASLVGDATRRLEELQEPARTAGFDVAEHFVGVEGIELGERQRLTIVSTLRAAAADGAIDARRPDVGSSPSALARDLKALVAAGHRTIVASRDRQMRSRLADALVEARVPVESVEDGDESSGREGVVSLAVADLPPGVVLPDARLALVTADDVFPRAATTALRSGMPAFDFTVGEYVVHSTHGIALFSEMTRRTVLGVERDYLRLDYAKGDKLFVPVEQSHKVTRYIGPDTASPRLTRLDTADWSRALGRARKAAKQLAFDLVEVYARRATVEGRAFEEDTVWQREMEAAFPFEETRDQLAAISSVKSDMEAPAPMDRLVCGDVGYGKTEVAIRAVFKAVQSGAQVMVLCPTTILAQQHFTTFSERFAPYPVRVEVLSRFRTKAQQREALEGLAEGTVDVVIGTHRLLSPDVAPKDLGLIVIDEEQRFGVAHKEHFKHLRAHVDVLTLTATPIPRTLQMALSGVRDLSIIDTPPADRFPIEVHVGEYDKDLVQAAIRAELERGGQVYYVFNRVKGIDEAVERVREAVPEARVAVAHGQMGESRLERVMESFSAGRHDVLVSTTIVESGLDNPHTNTLVIEDSQRLGLAQLYQLKGRVGRSHVKARAYFFFPHTGGLTDQATERLTAIQESAELGSGMTIAARDLEIRGAGTILGAEQHGNMSAVGFELYSRMLSQAVAESRGEDVPAFPEVRVDLAAAAFLGEEYVPSVADRVRIYRRLAAAPTLEAVERASLDLEEGHGPLPEVAKELFVGARVRVAAAGIGATSVTVTGGSLRIEPVRLTERQAARVTPGGGVAYDSRKERLSVALEGGRAAAETALDVAEAVRLARMET